MAESERVKRALSVLGPLEARVMQAVWQHEVPETFVVRDVRARMPQLAYTTVMTILTRLARKGVLQSEALPRQRAHRYRAAVTPGEFLVQATRQQVGLLVDRYGEVALAAFADRLDQLTVDQQRALKRLAEEQP